ncbi:dihydrofolate reductase [Shouchella lonarensis]|uniref:Dihydrofolate reductase n=1 Tax=Shouchella lonarensis TaxID=1464122 RepID=A0A1G6GHA2_9BACI|nr:dihydrofolate reductase [Shouchella lonarensis]SDB81381.1 dihydrofolate reductase [Shouchella lonarensis]
MISFIYARDKKGIIGNGNQLPWHLPADLRHFKLTTVGKTILMGRKTFTSIGAKPLPQRRNVVLTRDRSFSADGVDVVHTVAEIRALAKEETLYVIGGAEVFALLWDDCDQHIVTVIDHEFVGDTFVPMLDENEWHVTDVVHGVTDEKNRYPYEFRTYMRKQRADVRI